MTPALPVLRGNRECPAEEGARLVVVVVEVCVHGSM